MNALEVIGLIALVIIVGLAVGHHFGVISIDIGKK